MLEGDLFIGFIPGRDVRSAPPRAKKKADVVEYPEAFDHVGLLVNKPPGRAGLPFCYSSDDFNSRMTEPI
jgi:hypothetical protein